MSQHRVAAQVRLGRLGAFGAAGLSLSALGLVGLGVPCPWRALTGTLCPLCGSTHLGMSLLRGDLPGALSANPFVFVLLVWLVAVGAASIVELAGGPTLRVAKALNGERGWLVLGVLALVYAVARNVGVTP